jgi:crotonobetainyl-CoA:carnitine CoA-transferase CaiB-like acyl-CoA transferase
MIATVRHHAGGTVRVPASPLRLSATPVECRHGVPAVGEHSDAVLAEYAGMTAEEIAAAREAGLV